MATKMGNENAVVADPVIEETTTEDGSTRCLHQSGLTTIKKAEGTSDVGVGTEASGQDDGTDEAPAGPDGEGTSSTGDVGEGTPGAP